MDNQNNQAPNQNNPNTQAQQPTGSPNGVVQPNQPATSFPPTSAYGQPTVNYGPTPTPGSEPMISQAQPFASPVMPAVTAKHRNPLVMVGGALVVLFVIAAVGYLLITHNSKAAQFTYDHTVRGTQPGSGTTSSTTSDIGGEKTVPFATTATDGSFIVKLLGVTLNPTVTGAQPDAGTQYLEADFSVTSIANKSNYAFNILYLPSIVPSGDQMGDIELAPVDSSSPTSPLTFNTMSTKNVQIAGKTSMEQQGAVPFDGSAQTVTVYALFEVRPGDKGQIVWQGNNGGNYHFLTQ